MDFGATLSGNISPEYPPDSIGGQLLMEVWEQQSNTKMA
jgi:hypothetical protein